MLLSLRKHPLKLSRPSVTHLADRGVLRGEKSRLVAAPWTLFLPVLLPCCLRPELGAVRGVYMADRVPRTA